MKIDNIISLILETTKGYPGQTFEKQGCIYTFINPYKYQFVRKNNELYLSMDGVFVDGAFMCLLLRLFWGKKIKRLSFDMTGIASDLFTYLNQGVCNKTIYFIGSKQDEVERSVRQIQHAFPKMNVAGYRSGYFKNEEDRTSAINNIVELSPDYVVVGMGVLLQEKFVKDLKDKGFSGIAFTCGGFLHQTVNQINYYPKWVNRLNVRGFYRLFHEKGSYKRLFSAYAAIKSLYSVF